VILVIWEADDVACLRNQIVGLFYLDIKDKRYGIIDDDILYT
jgi:hypothetical protein